MKSGFICRSVHARHRCKWQRPPDHPARPYRGGAPRSGRIDKVEPLVLEELRYGWFDFSSDEQRQSESGRRPETLEKGRFVLNALRETAERTQTGLRVYLQAQGTAYEPFYIANKLLVRGGDAALLTELAARPEVAKITANHRYQLPESIIDPNPPQRALTVEPNISFINADDVWELGVTGGTVPRGTTRADATTWHRAQLPWLPELAECSRTTITTGGRDG
jgi:hypothetical protein